MSLRVLVGLFVVGAVASIASIAAGTFGLALGAQVVEGLLLVAIGYRVFRDSDGDGMRFARWYPDGVGLGPARLRRRAYFLGASTQVIGAIWAPTGGIIVVHLV